MNDTQQQNILQRKILWAEIKVLERNFKQNQAGIERLGQENVRLIKQLGEKLDKIQELGELFDEPSYLK